MLKDIITSIGVDVSKEDLDGLDCREAGIKERKASQAESDTNFEEMHEGEMEIRR